MSKVLARYNELVAAGELRADPEQAAAAARLDSLASQLEAVPKKGSILWRALGRRPEPPRGVYMWGGVGRGKSMLMDLLFQTVKIERKRRVVDAVTDGRGGTTIWSKKSIDRRSPATGDCSTMRARRAGSAMTTWIWSFDAWVMILAKVSGLMFDRSTSAPVPLKISTALLRPEPSMISEMKRSVAGIVSPILYESS